MEFANAVRQAGGANFLPRLTGSVPGNPWACLIAAALNFDCEIDGYSEDPPFDTHNPDATQWAMRTTVTVAEQLNAALDLPYKVANGGGGDAYVLLPEHIGNAAVAFDNEVPEFAEFVAYE